MNEQIRDLLDEQEGYKYQIFSKYKGMEWEHCDYAKDKQDCDYLLGEYRMAYGSDFTFFTYEF